MSRVIIFVGIHCSANSVPSVDRSTKPNIDHFTSVGGQTNNTYGFRDVLVPTELISKFMALAQPNTNKNVETCGILCGKLVSFSYILNSI